MIPTNFRSALPRVTRFDVLNAAVSALRDGVNSLYNLYLVTRLGFDPVQIGWILSTPSMCALVGQVPLGFLYDRLSRPGLAMALGAAGLGVIGLVLGVVDQPSFWLVAILQGAFGLATSTLSAGLPALTVNRYAGEALGRRLARNEVCAKVGNLSTLAAAGIISQYFSLKCIFVMMPVLAVVVILFGLDADARIERKGVARPSGQWLKSPAFYLFGFITLLLYFSNTAGLPIFEQTFGPTRPDSGAGWIAGVAALTPGRGDVDHLGAGQGSLDPRVGDGVERGLRWHRVATGCVVVGARSRRCWSRARSWTD